MFSNREGKNYNTYSNYNSFNEINKDYKSYKCELDDPRIDVVLNLLDHTADQTQRYYY